MKYYLLERDIVKAEDIVVGRNSGLLELEGRG